MALPFDYQAVIDRYYPQETPIRDIYMSHARSVASLALETAACKGLGLDPALVQAAAMLHDIGIVLCHAPSISCVGTLPYIAHGPAGADLLRSLGAPEELARVAERHTGTGLTEDDVRGRGLPPGRCYMPQSLLERLICYADKFYSKTRLDRRKTPAEAERSLAKFGPSAVARFRSLHDQFGSCSRPMKDYQGGVS